MSRLRVCIVGGVYGMPQEYRKKITMTPEITLAAGLRDRGVDVVTASHREFQPSDDFDIVHVHHLALGALKMASSGARPVHVFTSHNGELMSGFERSMIRRSALRYVLPRCSAVVALSSREAKFLQERSRGVPRIVVIPNGIRSDIFYPRPTGPRECTGRRTLLFVGSLVPLKGVDVLLRAFSSLAGGERYRLRLVYHNAGAENAYRRLCAELGIAERVEFVGTVPSAGLGEIYRDADLFVLPSRGEALPSVITEALLCGVPVVATDVGGVAEQVDKYGVVVQPGSVEALAAGLEEVLEKQSLFASLATEMHEYARRKFDPALMVDRHCELYDQLLAGPRERRRISLVDRAVRIAVRAY
jgi:glycosyltransferase involved in cell wall biosynthesis